MLCPKNRLVMMIGWVRTRHAVSLLFLFKDVTSFSFDSAEYEDEDYSDGYWNNTEVTNVEITE